MNFLCAAGKDEGQDGQASNPKGMHREFGTADTAGSFDCCAADFVPAGCELAAREMGAWLMDHDCRARAGTRRISLQCVEVLEAAQKA